MTIDRYVNRIGLGYTWLKVCSRIKLISIIETRLYYTGHEKDGVYLISITDYRTEDTQPPLPFCDVWVKSEKIHREDGPAIEFVDGGEIYMQKGKLHRTDGPAFIHITESGEIIHRYYLDGKEYSKGEWALETRSPKLESFLSEEDS